MHKKRLNHARLHVVLRPRGPLLIKSGIETPDPTRPQMEFVRTRHALHGETVYLPGTSLKGAIRAHAERALQGAGVSVCDPLALKQGDACHSKKWGDEAAPSSKFNYQCPACRTFGSLHLQGRTHIGDAYPWEPGDPVGGGPAAGTSFEEANRTEARWQVAIDRKTGQAHGGALFDLEVAVGGEFHAEIQLTNFQLWQLGLITAVLQEMDQGYVPIGFAKSRGLGQVAVELRSLSLKMGKKGAEALLGTAALVSEDERATYGLHADDALELQKVGLESENLEALWWGSRLHLESPEAVQRAVEGLLAGPLESYVASRQGIRVVGGRR